MKKIYLLLFACFVSLILINSIFAVAPTVTTNQALNVEETTATLNGTLTNDGGETTTAWFEYGTTTAYGNIGFDGIGFTLLDTQDDSNYYNNVWYNGTYIYTTFSGATNGVHAYSFNGTSFTLLDTQDDGGTYLDVWANDTYVYVAGGASGIRAYTFNGVSFNLEDTQDDGGGSYNSIWSDGTYVYVTCTGDGVRAYTFIGGNFVLVDTQDDGGIYKDVWGDGTYIYTVSFTGGIYAYSFNGVTFSLIDIQDDGNEYNAVWGDGTYIYTACTSEGIRAYSFDGATLTLLDTQDDGGDYQGVFVNGAYIFASCGTSGIRAYTFGASFNLLDTQDDGGDYSGTWANDTKAFVACFNDGVRAYNLTPFRNTGETFYTNITGLQVGQLYRFRTVANNSNTTVYGSDVAFLTKPNVTTSFKVATYSPGSFNLSWVKGTGANNTYIERNNIATWERGDGLLRYNDTDSFFNDSLNLLMNVRYYYQAWSFTNWTYNPTIYQFSDSYASDSNTTDNVFPPYDGSSTHTQPYLNVTWSRGVNSDREIVVQNNNSYPTSETDGWVRQNSTNLYWNDSVTYGAYFTIWSYNDSSGYYSVTGLDIPWGAIAIQCYDEINHTGLVFDVLITNADLETYYATDLTNIHYLDINDIPFGVNTIFYISNGTHESRTYYRDIFVNNFYNLTFYLPLSLPPDGGDPDNESYSILYLMTVIDERGETVQDVKMEILRYINETDTYEFVTILRSDANGQADVYLFSGTVYKVELSKTGYITRTDDWIPSDSIFTKTFKIYFEETEPSPPDVEPENIIFTGEISGTILYVNYTDARLETINTTVYVYEINISTSIETLFGSYTTTDNDSFQTSFTDVNSSNTYKIVLFYNHTTFGEQTKTLILDGTYTPLTTATELNRLLTAIIGSNPWGWANVLIFFFLLAGMYYADPKDSGIILVLLGGLFLFINLFVGFNTSLFTIAGGAIPVLFIVVGIITMWNQSHKNVSS